MSTSASISTNPSYENIKEYDTEQLVTFLRGKNLNLIEDDFAILRRERVAGFDFLQWTKETLRNEPYNFPDGPARRLVTLVNDLNSQSKLS
jgi:hypothetical protein